MVSLSDLPDETLLFYLLPVLVIRDVLVLGATSRRYAALCYDETFWKMKCKEEFGFSASRTAWTKGWRLIYKGLRNSKVFVWGSSSDWRLGLPRMPYSRHGGVLYPIHLTFPQNSAIIELIAGGWSFHALDSRGRVYVWGTLNAESFSRRSGGFSDPGQVSWKPLRLHLPEPVRTVSCGRKHSMALDCKGQIWTFLSWGRPFRLITPTLDNFSPETTPIQVECGWSNCAALTASGDVFAWWPFRESIQQKFATVMERMDAEGDKKARATAEDIIPCATWDLRHEPQRLPALPGLPELPRQGGVLGKDEKETKLVKIAAMDEFLVGLTNKGHVLKIGDLSDEASVLQAHWEYLPNFSETERVRAHSVFTGVAQSEDGIVNTVAPPRDVQITHITAHFKHFVAYTHEENSVVLRGSTDTSAEDEAEVIPGLQDKSIISVGLGDYHNAALSADGRLYTWGAFSQGALGLGVPKTLPVGTPGGYATQRALDEARRGHRVEVPDVKIPTEVRFDHGLKRKKDRFCFAATACGWHTGALVIDLDPESEDGVVEDEA